MRLRCIAIALAWSLTVATSWPTTEPFWPHHPNRTVHVLDGTWQFGYGGAVPDVINFDPAHAATPNTTVVPSAFDVAPPGVEGPRGAAFYRTDLPLAQGTAGMILFAACSFYCNVWVVNDGGASYTHLGDHRASGYAPFWLTVPACAATRRELLVLADNRFNATTAPTHTGGDFYNYGGITRNVVVYQQPADTYIRRVETAPTDWSAGGLNVSVVLATTAAAMPTSVTVDLAFDGGASRSVRLPVVHGVAFTQATVPSPKPWSPAAPHLHVLRVTLNGGDDVEEVRFGLRQLGVAAGTGRLTINGAVTKLRGYNRHTMWPDTGSALTLQQVQADVALLTESGVNFVRGAHYPQDQRFLDLCDEVGIAVWEETLGPGTSTTNLNDPYFLKYQVQAVNEMVSASFNHPSGVYFAFYNEGPSDDPKACSGYNVSASAVRARVATSNKMVTWASDKEDKDVCLHLADVVSFNDYPAWYNNPGNLSAPKAHWEAMAAWVAANYPDKPFGVSETGAGGVYEWTNASNPRWSQGYMKEVVMADVATIIGDDRLSALTLWQFSDIKANTGDTAKCGQCDYEPGVQPPTCGYIDVSCRRPGGENHKGAVDFWRRKKESYAAVAAVYNATTSL